jgi:hypothetical protein
VHFFFCSTQNKVHDLFKRRQSFNSHCSADENGQQLSEHPSELIVGHCVAERVEHLGGILKQHHVLLSVIFSVLLILVILALVVTLSLLLLTFSLKKYSD